MNACPECDGLFGRLRQLCDGSADLPLARINTYRQKLGLGPLGETDRCGVEQRAPSVLDLRPAEGETPARPTPKSRLPLGDWTAKAIQAATFGKVQPCGGCNKRKAAMNQAGEALVGAAMKLVGK